MKTTFIRALAIAMLATSLSAFAVTNDNKPADAAAPCANSKQAASSQNTRKLQKEEKSKQKQNDQKDKSDDQFSGIWG